MTSNEPLYQIQARDRYNQWIDDCIDLNEPRTRAECEADVAAFQAGECGEEYVRAYAPEQENVEWRIKGVDA